MKYIGNTTGRDLKNPEVLSHMQRCCRNSLEHTALTKDSECTVLGRISNTIVCSYTAYVKVEGMRGKVLHLALRQGVIKFLLLVCFGFFFP